MTTCRQNDSVSSVNSQTFLGVPQTVTRFLKRFTFLLSSTCMKYINTNHSKVQHSITEWAHIYKEALQENMLLESLTKACHVHYSRNREIIVASLFPTLNVELNLGSQQLKDDS